MKHDFRDDAVSPCGKCRNFHIRLIYGRLHRWPQGDEVALVHLRKRRARARALPIPILAASLVLSLLANSAAKGVPIEARELEAPADSLVLRKSSFVLDACRLIDRVARANAIPADYVARLISVESGFSPTAVSPKGAQGIAQFMPETARVRGLADPFEPGPALKAAI